LRALPIGRDAAAAADLRRTISAAGALAEDAPGDEAAQAGREARDHQSVLDHRQGASGATHLATAQHRAPREPGGGEYAVRCEVHPPEALPGIGRDAIAFLGILNVLERGLQGGPAIEGAADRGGEADVMCGPS